MEPPLLHRSRAARVLLPGAMLLALPLLAFAAVGQFPSPAVEAARYEQRMLLQMIDRDMLAIELAQLCGQRAPHEELASACREIASARGEQMARMRDRLASWYGIEPAQALKPVAVRREAMLERLPDEEFEATFLDMMTVDQEQAVDEATACLERVQQPELQMLCAEIAEQQTARVEQMRDWLCRWHHLQCDVDW